MLTVYGIKNCDKCRAATRWFDAQQIDYSFHDVRADGLSATQVSNWLKQTDAKVLVNTRSKTWRDIPTGERSLDDPKEVSRLVERHPTLLKRPLVDDGKKISVGYDEAHWTDKFA